MTGASTRPQITVLDAGGQYCHLIARKVRESGVYADVRPAPTPASALAGRRGLIISGGPSSVYEAGSPSVDPGIFALGIPVLGICYGHQLMAHLLGGAVQRGEKGEYGLAILEHREPNPLLAGLPDRHQVWMSHRDTVTALPPGFRLLARTGDCPVAAMGDPARRLYGVQFHPEVAHTVHGRRILENFLFAVCACHRDWDLRGRLSELEALVRRAAGDRNVFFFVSGGVDSAVAFTLCLRSLGPQRVRGFYVDTGLMREGETEFVRELFERLAPGSVRIVEAAPRFLAALAGVSDPERKRRIIGDEFIRIQQEILESGHFLEGDWMLGQGTIYPDTIESGGTGQAAVIKTHHNRAPGVQRLLEAGCVVEPLSSFYKDEVREIGRELGLPAELLERHPFPGPGLAIRCLCAEAEIPMERAPEGWLAPLRSVGVQGDSRSYRAVLVLEERPAHGLELRAAELVNRMAGINRVVARVAGHAALESVRVRPASLTPERLARLRRADALVREISHRCGFDRQVWQFPVVLVPLGEAARPDSVVLRPVDSVDGMTARAVLMEPALLDEMATALLAVEGISAVFYDLTHKPPATIEWE
ncbi:MAG: glutamine-hydrolyzing GMP synthase [Bryobacterales bacterium]|nr:glutamine-hydrolyzing GMP synthase [Bryobacteraceae bacterium]MDW8130033.1 glutamine-hydrolyzing GMP synthase [Bryobacterales bacterium]